MSNGHDNQGKPPGPGAPPPVAPAKPAMPRVTAPQAPPLVPQVTPTQPVAPVVRPPPAGAPPSRTNLPTVSAPPNVPMGGKVPPPGAARPAMPVITPVAPAMPPAVAPAVPARPAAPPAAGRPAPAPAPIVPPVSGPSSAGVLVPPVSSPSAAGAPRPGAIVPPAPATARPPSGPLVPPAPAAVRPAGAPIVPPAPPAARPAGVPLVPPAPPAARPAGAPLVPPAPPAARPAGAVLVPPASGAAPAAAAPRRAGPLPETGSVETITPQQAAGLRTMAGQLDALDYYEALGVAHTATPGDIKKAFYRESRTYHPDRFFHLPESQVKEDIGSIYKRMTEAYYVLRDDAKRKKYLADVTGPERKNKLRYTEATESELKAEARKTVEEEWGTNPKARPFFKTAMAEFDKGNWNAAVSAFKTGLMYEPGNTRFKEKLAEAQKKFDESRKGANSFMIK